MKAYKDLTDAMAILTGALRDTDMNEPAWDFIKDAKNYLAKQANIAMRGE